MMGCRLKFQTSKGAVDQKRLRTTGLVTRNTFFGHGLKRRIASLNPFADLVPNAFASLTQRSRVGDPDARQPPSARQPLPGVHARRQQRFEQQRRSQLLRRRFRLQPPPTSPTTGTTVDGRTRTPEHGRVAGSPPGESSNQRRGLC